jgi:N-acetylglutamate synthase-like GNAT family acetyltransferase
VTRHAVPQDTSRALEVCARHGYGSATDADVSEITRLVHAWAETGLTLPRREAEVRSHLGQFVVARDECGRVLGCAAVSVVVPGLAEVRSVVVDPDLKGRGISRLVMRAVAEAAAQIGVDELVLLTKAPGFFEKHGFEAVDPMRLPAAFVQRVVLEPGRSFVNRTAMRRLRRVDDT